MQQTAIFSLKNLCDFKARATDGELGKVEDILFDEHQWIIRYLVIMNGSWSRGRKVLVSPRAAKKPEAGNKILPLDLNRARVDSSPPVTSVETVSRKMEEEISKHFQWPLYWMNPSPMFPLVPSWPDEEAESNGEGKKQGDSGKKAEGGLRSFREVSKYSIEAKDGKLGHVEDFLYHETFWKIRYMVVDTRNFLHGEKVIVALRWIRGIDWLGQKVHVDLEKQSIENAPTYDPSQPLTPEYENELYNYYGRPYE